MIPSSAEALTMAEIISGSAVNAAENLSGEAKAYVVIDRSSGQILLSKNADLKWPPASLTKLVTAMVFMESNTSLNKVIAMKKEDEVGGQRLVTKTGVSYKTRDLLHAALISSHNNAAHALARSTNLTDEQFIDLMNNKAKALGAVHTHFLESTGMNPLNYTTALDFAKIVDAALKDPYISLITKKNSYSFTSVNNKKYKHKITSTNKLLTDTELSLVGGKTGFLEESDYNFASVTKDQFGNEFVIVVLGAKDQKIQFGQTKSLALRATAIKVFGFGSQVAGTSTAANINFNK
jgi:D-alanyl-D-alanine endopeptidase (penicillin-binding protein 7)